MQGSSEVLKGLMVSMSWEDCRYRTVSSSESCLLQRLRGDGMRRTEGKKSCFSSMKNDRFM